MNNWEIEKTVWDRVFGGKGRGLKVRSSSCVSPVSYSYPCASLHQINPHNTPLVVTEPVFNLPNVQEHYDQIVFEEYEFDSYLRVPGELQLSSLSSLDSRLI